MAKFMTHPGVGAAAVAAWVVAVASGFAAMAIYGGTPGETRPGAARWPAESTCPLSPERPTLVMFVHPQCPCTRASLQELAELMPRVAGRVQAHVVFLEPARPAQHWTQTDLRDSAADIPGVERRLDRDGIEQRRFGAAVSGEVFLYMPDGTLRFQGGITPGRGHAGNNAGRQALESILLAGELPQFSTAVFGCPLGESPVCRAGRCEKSGQGEGDE